MKKFFKILLASFCGALLAMLFFAIISFSMLSGIASSFSKETTPVVPASAILKLDFSETISEQGIDDPFASLNPMVSSSKSISIRTLVEAIDKAAEDNAIKFIYMNTDKLMGTELVYLEELRSALMRFRESGKAIVSWATNYDQSTYYIASTADKIYVEPNSANFFLGISTNLIFFKDLLDNLGIEIQLIRHGKYKAAAEQFVNKSISKENLEQNKVMLGTMWSTMVESICSSREITPGRFNYLVDNLELLLPESLAENNLIDGVKYKDEMDNYLCEIFGVSKAKDLKSISASKYHQARKKTNLKIKDKIAILYVDGEIVDGDENNMVAGNRFANIISRIRQDSTVKALVMRVNSPGGSSQASALIERELGLLKQEKPIVVSMGTYAASGGYWIAANADKIFTNSTTLTGSIGVFSLVPNFAPGMKKHLSLNSVPITTNKHSDIMGLMRPLDKTETELMQLMVDNVYTDFLNVVSQGRNMSVSEVDAIGEGRVWAGGDATTIGLADSIGGLHDAILYAASLAQLDGYRIIEYPTPVSPMEKVMQSLNMASATISAFASPEEAIGKLYSNIGNNGKATTFARLPYIYNFSY